MNLINMYCGLRLFTTFMNDLTCVTNMLHLIYTDGRHISKHLAVVEMRSNGQEANENRTAVARTFVDQGILQFGRNQAHPYVYWLNGYHHFYRDAPFELFLWSGRGTSIVTTTTLLVFKMIAIFRSLLSSCIGLGLFGDFINIRTIMNELRWLLL